MTIGLGPWDQLPVTDAAVMFEHAPFRWWISPGHALELHVGAAWPDHDDLDVSLCRTDAPRIADVLIGWDIHIAAAGVLHPWQGQVPVASKSQNNLWCRPPPSVTSSS